MTESTILTIFFLACSLRSVLAIWDVMRGSDTATTAGR
jgi:hypothetical protein